MSDLPKIDPARLQRAAMAAELRGPSASLSDLCKAIAASTWATESGLSATAIGQLIELHNTIIKTPKTETPVATPKAEVAA